MAKKSGKSGKVALILIFVLVILDIVSMRWARCIYKLAIVIVIYVIVGE